MTKLIAGIANAMVAAAILVITLGPMLGYSPVDDDNVPIQPAGSG